MGKRAKAKAALAKKRAEDNKKWRKISRSTLVDPGVAKALDNKWVKVAHKIKRKKYRSREERDKRAQLRKEEEKKTRDLLSEYAKLGIPGKYASLGVDLTSVFAKGKIVDLNFATKMLPKRFPNKVVVALEYNHPSSFSEMDGEAIRLWHGTGKEGVLGITIGGFRLPFFCGMLGRGVYGAPSIYKAINYIKWFSEGTTKRGVAKIGSLGWLFLAEAKVGKSVVSKGRFTDTSGYDSAFAESGVYTGAWRGMLRRSEYCIFDPARISPKYLFILRKG